MDLTGRVAIVTGAASGIGRAIAEVIAEAGAEGVAIADVNLKGANETVALVESCSKARGLAVETDVSNESQVTRLAEAALEEFGRVDILVNNAGICPTTPWDDTTLDSWNRILGVNLTSAYLCTRAVLPHMRRRKYGRIVNISSAAAFLGSVVAHVAYGVSKAGMIALTKSIAKEFASEGIRANAVAPGSIDTPLTDSFGDEIKGRLAELSPMKRQGTPMEIADAVLFLVSDRASFVNGATLHVNGGMLMV